MIEGESPVSGEPASPASATGSRPARSTLLDLVRGQIRVLQSYHRAVMETGEEEAIHKMRVTTRRLQASIDLLISNHRHSDRDKTERYVRKLKKRLRKWRRLLSRVRNYDVFSILIEKETARRRSHREQYELLKGILNQHRTANIEKVRQKLEGINIVAIAARLGIDSVPDTTETTNSEAEKPEATKQSQDQAAVEARARLTDERKIALRAAQRLEQRVEEFHVLAAGVHPTTHPEELHQLRIAAKRVRYLLEIISEMGVGKSDRALAWLRSLQDRIGDWHDLEALEEEIIAIVSQRGFMKEHLAESSRILQAAAQLQKKKVALVARLFPITVPKHLGLTSERLIRALRRKAAREESAT
ncbi:MAG TPA: CHAD domain-containing protein [Blastocatellia bacterium]|nr:CHAD domain-containing protein [Blastocatellia bacterium]